MSSNSNSFPADLAEAVHHMTFEEVDDFVSEMFKRSELLPHVFSKAIYCNLKKREAIENGVLSMSPSDRAAQASFDG